MLEALRGAGLEGNTIVVFTSDNGGERFSYQWPLRGAKFELWEGGIRVPTIVRWPARIAAGSTPDQLVMTMDWLPTLLAAAGYAPDPEFPSDGLEVLNILTGARAPRERAVFWRTHRGHAVRSGAWKYVWDDGHEYLLSHDLPQATCGRSGNVLPYQKRADTRSPYMRGVPRVTSAGNTRSGSVPPVRYSSSNTLSA